MKMALFLHGNENLLACRACLATDRKLLSINQQNLSFAYRNLTGIEVTPYDKLPQYVCSYCTALLLKYDAFRNTCLRSKHVLSNATLKDKILLQNNSESKSQYQITRTTFLSITENETIDDEYNIINFEYKNNDEISSPHHSELLTEDIKVEIDHQPNETQIFTGGIKIEKDVISEMNSKFIPNEYSNTDDEYSLPNKRDIKTENINKSKSVKKSKFFDINDFEKNFEVNIIELPQEEQIKEFMERKMRENYLHSPYKCDLCYKGYMGADLLEKHRQSQHDSSRGNIVCAICKFRYKDRRGLNQHLKSHRLKFICKQCPYVSRTSFHAKEHFKMHEGRTHKCQFCGKSNESVSNHLSHLRFNHPSELIWCDVCGESFIGDFGLKVHKKKAHRLLSLQFTCKSCSKSFIDITALNHHISLNKCTENTCIHCGETFDVSLKLREHLIEKHRTKKMYNCEKCNKTYKSETHYSAHYKRKHIEEDDVKVKKSKPWICEVCGKAVPNKCVLRYHQRNHTGERPYECSQCPKTFTVAKLLRSHLRVHTDDRPFVCKLCPKTFKGLSALRGHELIHKGGQPKPVRRKKVLQSN